MFYVDVLEMKIKQADEDTDQDATLFDSYDKAFQCLKYLYDDHVMFCQSELLRAEVDRAKFLATREAQL